MAIRIRIERTQAPVPGGRRRGWTVAAATVVAVALITGVSYAYWTATGSGSGSSKSLQPVAAQVTAVTSAADLYPGGVGAVSFTVKNPNPYQVTFDQLLAGTVTSGSGACPASWITVTTPVTVSITVAPGATSALQTVPAVTKMDVNAPNGCQDVVFTVTLNLTGKQT